MADAWLFFMNLMLGAGMTAEDLERRAIKKQMAFERRMSEGYDGVSTKCPVCRRAYDNEAVKCQPATTRTPALCYYQPVGGPQCPVCSAAINAPGTMCRPASHYLFFMGLAATENICGPNPVVFPKEPHCALCLTPFSEGVTCHNSLSAGWGWCSRWNTSHSPAGGVLHHVYEKSSQVTTGA